jgi:hypothetical protein
MTNGEISNGWAGALWFVVGVSLALWYGGRRRAVSRRLRDEAKGWPPEERGRLRLRAMKEAFAAAGVILGVFLLLDWIW